MSTDQNRNIPYSFGSFYDSLDNFGVLCLVFVFASKWLADVYWESQMHAVWLYFFGLVWVMLKYANYYYDSLHMTLEATYQTLLVSELIRVSLMHMTAK